MPDDPPATRPADNPGGSPRWHLLDVLQTRADRARALRETSIGDLRAEMGDKEIRTLLGIDLSGLEA